MVETAEDIDPLDRSGPDDSTSDRNRAFGPRGGAHRQAVHRELHVNAPGGGDTVAAARLDRVEHCLTRQRVGEHARETTVGPERRGAGMAGARASLVAVRVGDYAALVAPLARLGEE